ncbi:Elongation factor Ts [Frankliniella fusca]|uniref:Elongation factor Ts n=1 Tax=Frankliniella fusca TaxID=407009 RepID=A0AAE1LP44_9NEOP|nr:Elongation factor Ts [Frankliniella fusca]
MRKSTSRLRGQRRRGFLITSGEEDPLKRRRLQHRDVPRLQISDLATTRTKDFFTILGLKCDFLEKSVCEWENMDDYRQAREIAVINDHAERGVKLMNNCRVHVTKKGDSFQDLLVNAHSHRQSVPNVKKETLAKKYKF